MLIRTPDGRLVEVKVNEYGLSFELAKDDWSQMDTLPESDPIGDIDPMEQFKKDDKAYMENIGNKSEWVNTDWIFENITISKDCCNNPDKYKNIISNSLKFYSCRNCGADLGNIDD
tara:strand:+ start:4658 stop:5005 length:348 start_codon:yes stop_codon:yes gene_type:complete